MNKVRTFINYETTEKPWGGSNSFLYALKSYLADSNDISIVQNRCEDFDLMLLNTAYAAPGKYISLGSIKKYHRYGHPGIFQLCMNRFKKKSVKIVLRLDGLRQFYADTSNVKGDSIQLDLINHVDAIIFQSQESLKQFKSTKGDIPVPYFIIFNGVNQKIFNMQNKIFRNKKDKLNIFTTSWSTNPRKGFSDIAGLSRIKDVVVNFVGNWPDGISKENVNIKPPMPQYLLAKEYKNNDIFFFPSHNESCPNVIYEALSCGLPLIYHPSGGTPEIASSYGVALTDNLYSNISEISENYNSLIEKIKKDHHIFSIDYAGTRYADVFHKVVQDKAL